MGYVSTEPCPSPSNSFKAASTLFQGVEAFTPRKRPPNGPMNVFGSRLLIQFYQSRKYELNIFSKLRIHRPTSQRLNIQTTNKIR